MHLKKTASLVGLFGFLIASCTSGGDGVDQESADLILSGHEGVHLTQMRNSTSSRLRRQPNCWPSR